MELKTAESVSPLHPDKICDRISDAILDECLKQDPQSRVAMETMGGHGIVTVTGELTTNAYINVRKIVKDIVGDKYGVQTNIVEQSREISQGVDSGGAGDQGIMVGYACNETPEFMPLEVMLARELNAYIFAKHPFDGKTQITLRDGKVDTIVASFQSIDADHLQEHVRAWADTKELGKFTLFVNPAGDWNVGGFEADTGLTGRKLAVDAYGPRIPIGGGAFSGKDATKVDRSGAYMARKIAVDYLKSLDAKEVYVYLAYAIGVANPVQAIAIVDGKEMEVGGYDLTPEGIIKFLDLRKAQFQETARYGHFGNGFTWDK